MQFQNTPNRWQTTKDTPVTVIECGRTVSVTGLFKHRFSSLGDRIVEIGRLGTKR